MRKQIIAAAVTGVLCQVLAYGAMAQPAAEAEYRPPAQRVLPDEGLLAQIKPKGTTPRLADGHPDFNGVWGPGPVDAPYTAFGVRSWDDFEDDQVVMQRGNPGVRPAYKPEQWDEVHNRDFGKIVDDPAFHCQSYGVPRMGMPAQIVMTPTRMVTLNSQYVATTRVVPIDGRPHTEDDIDQSTLNGIPIAHWDGDTLVIESTGFNGETWLSFTGYLHTDKMKVTERLWRNGDVLYYNFTVDDPDVLERPWTSSVFIRRLSPNPLARIEEAPPCKELDSDEIPDVYYRG